MDYEVAGEMTPSAAFMSEHHEAFVHGDFEIVVDGAQLAVGYDDPSRQGAAVALGRSYVNHLTVQTSTAISWTPNRFRSPSPTGTGDLVAVSVEDRATFSEALGIVVTHADGTVEPMRTDKDLHPSLAVMRCLEALPELVAAQDYAAEYLRSRNLKHLSRLWDVLMAATGAKGDQARTAAIAKSVGEPPSWANDVGQSLHSLRHETTSPARLSEAQCLERARLALLGLIRERCP